MLPFFGRRVRAAETDIGKARQDRSIDLSPRCIGCDAALLRDLPEVSQQMLTQHLRERDTDRLIRRRDLGEVPLGWNTG